jgi:hypothetical protein
VKIRSLPLIALWLVVLGLWAVVLLRSPQTAGTPRLPALGPTPSVTAPPGSTPAPSFPPGQLQAGPIGAAPANDRAANTVDAEDRAEGDVEDEAPRPAGSTASAAGVGATIVIPAVPHATLPSVHTVALAPLRYPLR